MATNAVQAMSSDARHRLAFADAGVDLAGHEITDPMLRDIVEHVAGHEITADEAVAEARRHRQS